MAHSFQNFEDNQAQICLGVFRRTELWFRIACCFISLIAAIVISLVLLTDVQNTVAVPALVICFLFFLFCVLLDSRVKSGIVGEIGFVFTGFAVAYSVIPGLNFLLINFDFPPDFDGLNFSVLSPQPSELGDHLWRHCLFIAAVTVGYLMGRGRDRNGRISRVSYVGGWPVVAAILTMILICISTISLLSAPVEDYYGHYSRFDSLSWGVKRLVYICLILKGGGYYVALVLMFADYCKYKYLIVAFLAAISAYELVYSLGSRIETLSILLAAVCLYNLNVKKIRIKYSLLYFGGLLILFTLVEFYRSANFDLSLALDGFMEKGLKIATEFGAVYYTSFHLYFERLNGTMPSHDLPMLINDFFTIVPFYEHTEFSSQYWYARIFFPDAVVPPQTMGPIADSAIWGGEVDLALRGLFTGFCYGWLTRRALRSRNRLLLSVVYVFLFATSVISIKYSIIYQLSQMLRTLMPALLSTYIVMEAVKWLSSNTLRQKKAPMM